MARRNQVVAFALIAGILSYQNCSAPPDPVLFDQPIAGNCRNNTNDCVTNPAPEAPTQETDAMYCALGTTGEIHVPAGTSAEFFLTSNFSLSKYPGYKAYWYTKETTGPLTMSGVDNESFMSNQNPATWQFTYRGEATAPFNRSYYVILKDSKGTKLCDTRGGDASGQRYAVKTYDAPRCTFSFTPAQSYIGNELQLTMIATMESGQNPFPTGAKGYFVSGYTNATGTLFPMSPTVSARGSVLSWKFGTAKSGETNLANRASSIRILLPTAYQGLVQPGTIQYVDIYKIIVKTSTGDVFCTTSGGGRIGIQL